MCGDLLRIDTDPKMEEVYRQLVMILTPEERFLAGLRMCEEVRALVLASLPQNLQPADRKVAILRRYYQNDFSEQVLARIEQSLRTSSSVSE
jgi:hypothetical protein